MKKIEFTEVEKSIENIDIIEFENKFNIKLPENYKRLMLKFNGGVPLDRVVYSDGDELTIGGFCSIKYGDILLENSIYDYQIREKIIPVGYIPVAYDAFDNTYSISINKIDYGKIYCRYFDTGDDEETLVADSLEEFLGGEF